MVPAVSGEVKATAEQVFQELWSVFQLMDRRSGQRFGGPGSGWPKQRGCEVEQCFSPDPGSGSFDAGRGF